MQLYNYSQIGCKVTTFFAYNKHFMQDFLHKMHKKHLPFPSILPFASLLASKISLHCHVSSAP